MERHPLRSARPPTTVNHMVHHAAHLDAAFGALADATRRGILDRLARGEASISDLAGKFDMTLTGMKKHVHVLETAGLVTTRKVGRVRSCRADPRGLVRAASWMVTYQHMFEQRLDHLEAFLERDKGENR
jgi:DNA-binding transcriptional ArsR family regulator